MILPAVAIFLGVWTGSRSFVIQQVEREYKEMANCILNVVRARYDMIQNDQYLRDQQTREKLGLVADTLLRTARELQLESGRRNLTVPGARAVFLSIVREVSLQGVQVSVIDTEGKVAFSHQLPKGFDVSDYPWIRNMIHGVAGNVRFSWQYPGEAAGSERQVAYRLIQGWDWILYTESSMNFSENSDFADQQYQGLTDFISAYHAPAGGYAMILSAADGRIISHPEMSGGSLDQLPGADRMISVRQGNVTYEDSYGVRWRTGLAYFAPKQWIIAVTGREDQILKEIKAIIYGLQVAAGIVILIVLLIFFRMQRAMLYAFKSKTRISTSGK